MNGLGINGPGIYGPGRINSPFFTISDFSLPTPAAMRSATELINHALEVQPALLPHVPALLADFAELGSSAEQIVDAIRDLLLPPPATVVDLGCGQGAVSVAIARHLGLSVLRIESADRLRSVDEMKMIRRGAAPVQREHPELAAELQRFVQDQASQHQFLGDNLVGVLWVLQKESTGSRCRCQQITADDARD